MASRSNPACRQRDEGVSLPLDNFGVGQRLFNIYDGPAYQESNIYLDISTSPCNKCMYAQHPGLPKADHVDGNGLPATCPMRPSAGSSRTASSIRPPSTRAICSSTMSRCGTTSSMRCSRRTPIWIPTVQRQIQKDYCAFSDVSYPRLLRELHRHRPADRAQRRRRLAHGPDQRVDSGQRAITDAATGTISVNPIEFFNAPVETAECLSNLGITPNSGLPGEQGQSAGDADRGGAKTSPYDYVTTVVFPECG